MPVICQGNDQVVIMSELTGTGDLVTVAVVKGNRCKPLGQKCLRGAVEQRQRPGICLVFIKMLHLLDEKGAGSDGRRFVDLAVDDIDEMLHAHL